MKALVALAFVAALALPLAAQGPAPAAPQGGRAGGPPAGGPGRGGPPPAPQAQAPVDLTGTWVAVISEDWRWRMVTPAKGDYMSIPLSQAGKDLADQWDPAKDEAAGDQCKSYGAPGLMRAPTRLRISWQDERTLKVESDYGQQTRVLRFAAAAGPGAGAAPGGAAAAGAPSRQGSSVAAWEIAGRRGGPATGGTLRVVTTNLLPGYLRKNGVPYGANTTYTEYWDAFTRPNGDRWVIITSIVRDPQHLQVDWITSLNFKKEADGSKWDPTPCSTTW